jgi:hypothetical protein
MPRSPVEVNFISTFRNCLHQAKISALGITSPYICFNIWKI